LLDPNLAYSRHYPAVNWISSYSSYIESLSDWWSLNISDEFETLRKKALDILFKEESLRNIVRLLGPEVLLRMRSYY